MSAIYKRELSSYFNSMIGYVFIAAMVFFNGIYFMAYNIYSGLPDFSYCLMSMMSILMFTVPILTMKAMAEERHSRTDQLLLTAPVPLWQVVLGKYLAMVTVFLIPVLLSAFCPLIIAASGEAHLLSDYATLLAFFLMGCVFIAVGMFLSSLTESQIIAAVGTFAVLLLFFLWEDLMSFLPGALSNVLSAFAFRTVFYNFAQYQVFDLSGLILYGSLAALFVFLTIQTLLRRRWN